MFAKYMTTALVGSALIATARGRQGLGRTGDAPGQPLIEGIADAWTKTPSGGGRHARRVNKIKAIEEGKDPTGILE